MITSIAAPIAPIQSAPSSGFLQNPWLICLAIAAVLAFFQLKSRDRKAAVVEEVDQSALDQAFQTDPIA